MKFVRCLRGRVWDVVADLRAGSPTFLRWHRGGTGPGTTPGCWSCWKAAAHGFQVLEADSELLYLHTRLYEPSAEGGVRYDDPRLGIAWPPGPRPTSPNATSATLASTGTILPDCASEMPSLRPPRAAHLR